ncbi:MAG: transcriptional repressor LexA [Planctomycetes bacterium]|nr:transcriptional repressor LexA [Planctomycetota bacterium]
MTPARRKKTFETTILRPRQLEILRLIDDCRRRNGCSPTLLEMAEKLALSKVTIFEHVEALVEKKILRRQRNKARSLIINPGYKLPAGIKSKTKNTETGSGCFPLAGVIAAGIPLEAVENPDMLDLNEVFPDDTSVFALKVTGDSMIDEQIRDGDFVLVSKNNQPRRGQIVVALLENGEATLKKFYRHKKGYCLKAANPEYEPIYTDQLNIQGIVIGVIRKY